MNSSHEGTKVVNEGPPKLKTIDRTNNEADLFPGEETLLVRESLASLPNEDPELGLANEAMTESEGNDTMPMHDGCNPKTACRRD